MINKLIAALVVVATASICGTAAQASECGEVSVAEMDWQSAKLLANVDAIILEHGFDCDVTLVPGDTMATFTTMDQESKPDVAPEMWINAYRDKVDAAVKEGRLQFAARALTDGGVEGWWIPNYIAEAYPEIRTVRDALEHPELFPDPQDDSIGAVHTCPTGWNCRISTGNLFKAYDAEEKGFKLVQSQTGQELNDSIAEAFENNRGWLGYYWAPTATLGKYEMVRLSFDVPHDKAEWNRCTSQPGCEDPKPNAWPKSEVYTVVTEEFHRSNIDAYGYLSKRGWANHTVNGMLAWMIDNQASAEDGARHFLMQHGDVWEDWVSPETADKIKAYLAAS